MTGERARRPVERRQTSGGRRRHLAAAPMAAPSASAHLLQGLRLVGLLGRGGSGRGRRGAPSTLPLPAARGLGRVLPVSCGLPRRCSHCRRQEGRCSGADAPASASSGAPCASRALLWPLVSPGGAATGAARLELAMGAGDGPLCAEAAGGGRGGQQRAAAATEVNGSSACRPPAALLPQAHVSYRRGGGAAKAKGIHSGGGAIGTGG